MTQTTAHAVDPTLDPARRSWIAGANAAGSDFPIQNLPLGVFRRAGGGPPRIGIAIGDSILDLPACLDAGLLDALDEKTAAALTAPVLNPLMALGRAAWSELRHVAGDLLDAGSPALRDDAGLQKTCVVDRATAVPVVPATIGDYTDFYASIHHATNVGSMFRPDNPLLPNYRHLPVGYHGRASSIVISGAPVRRPKGQTKADAAEAPEFGPCRLLDYELEMGFFVGPGNELGRRIPMGEARQHIFGMVIVNDWSARDVQKWEYQPLGPFNAKNFATTISPWIVTLDALEPFRVPGPPRGPDDPPMLQYLKPRDDGGYDIAVEVWLSSAKMRAAGTNPLRISRGTFADMYWTLPQMLVHHTSTGCNLRSGDLIASGTVSGPDEAARGCLLERTWRGQNAIDLPDGTQRKFLQDGDEVIIRAWCERPGAARIGFGECRGVIEPAEQGRVALQEKIDRFLAGTVFAVVGASRDRRKYGNKVLRAYLQNHRTAHPVNPNADEVEGLPAYPSLAALPQVPHGISVITPPAVTERIVEEAIELGIGHIWMQPGAESPAASDRAESAGANVIAGGACALVVMGYRE